MLIALTAALWFGESARLPTPEIGPETAARYEAAFAAAHSRLLPVDLSTSKTADDVARAIPADPAKRRALVADALAGRRALGSIKIWDNMVEDGDAVRLSCGGLSVEVPLTKAGATFVLPYAPGDVLTIEGLHDGDGGGITAAIEVAAGPIPLPPLHPGERRILKLF